ncbi:MAG: translocation/assembly module TamB domain-containing protein [Pseudomonadota bacterium]
MKTKNFPKLRWIITRSIIVFFFISTIYLFFNTQKGLEISIALAQQWMPGNLKIAQLNGCLLGPIHIKNLQYKNSDVALSISAAQFDWHWSDLMQGHFTVAPLTIDKLSLSIKETDITQNSNQKRFKLPWVLNYIKLNSVDIKELLIHYGNNFLKLNGSLHQQWNFDWQLTIPELKKFISESNGKLNLQGKIQGNRTEPKLYFLFPKTNLSWNDWQLNQAQGELHLDSSKNKKWSFKLQANQLKNTTLSLSPIRINLTGNLQPFSLQGSLSDFKSKIESVQIPILGLHLKNINLALNKNKNVLQGYGQIDSGKGLLTFKSKTQLNQSNFPSVIELQGNNVEISHTQEYKITASPKLQIQANTQHVEATGLISFPKARIKIKETNANLVELSNDVVFVNHNKPSISLPFSYKTNFKLQLGNDIRFRYQGLRTKVTGTLDVTQSTDHPILATGELILTEGEYSYYGQRLKLQPHSLLNFANSPINNPNLDVIASKSVWVLPNINNENTNTLTSNLGSSKFISSALQTTQPIPVTVGVHLQGYLENPQITLYADPSSAISSQLEILSYLVTGQPSSQLSAGSLQLLLNAATQVGGKKTGVSQFINTAQKKIGLDQLTIGANPIFNPSTNKLQQNTSLIIGKNFSPRLNVSYSIGLLDPISILQINYLLNKNFSLQSTNSNFANGIDLLYKIERK